MDEKIVKDSQGLAKDLVNDCISRKAAIDIVKKYDKSHMILMGKPMLGAAPIVIELEDLPSAQPERKRGRWIPLMHLDVLDGYQCSACKAWSRFKHNFCRNCGTDMREDDHETD